MGVWEFLHTFLFHTLMPSPKSTEGGTDDYLKQGIIWNQAPASSLLAGEKMQIVNRKAWGKKRPSPNNPVLFPVLGGRIYSLLMYQTGNYLTQMEVKVKQNTTHFAPQQQIFKSLLKYAASQPELPHQSRPNTTSTCNFSWVKQY